MPTYQYQIREQAGGVSKGQISAGSISEAAGALRSRGGRLVDLTPAESSPKSLLDRIRTFSIDLGPGPKDVLNFTSQLSVMIRAGINVRGAIEGIGEQIENPKFQKVVKQICLDVESGKPFSDALASHPKVFSPLYVNLVRASEMSGNFGHMLDRIAGYLQQQIDTRSMVRGAMIYPIIIAVMAVTTTVFLLTFVLPKFTTLFQGKEDLLPKATLALLAISHFLRYQWYLVVGGLGGGIAGFCYGIRTPRGHEWWDGVKLKMPLLRRMFRALYITRGLQTMGEMINAGVPMLETIRITAEVSGNTQHRRMWMAVRDSVKGGKTIAAPLLHNSLLSRNVVQMISAGEESGRLGEVLGEVAEFYGKELRNTIKAVTAMIEPLMIVIMGVVVGFIAMSIILPIFKLSQLVK